MGKAIPSANALLDQDQIVEDWCFYKLGAGSRLHESPAPISPIPRTPEVGVVISAIDYGHPISTQLVSSSAYKSQKL